MAMPSRSVRDTTRSIMYASSTPGTVGPGTYAPSSSIRAGMIPNFAAFSSSDARKLNNSGGEGTATPGPGSYLPVREIERQPVSSNAFKSSVPRLAPSAPGSTCFVASSVVLNPGPGNYRNPFKDPYVNPQRPRSIKREPAATRVMLVLGSESNIKCINPPAIPRPEQSCGYDETSDGHLVPLQTTVEIVSGVGADTVGPAGYDIPQSLKKDGTVFSRSATQRRVFEAKRIPGPGDYNPMTAYDIKTLRGAIREAEGLACFKSRVPMAFEVTSKSPETNEGGPRLLGPAENKPDWPSILQCFGSTSERAGWDRKANVPYTAPTSFATPGPGSYASETTSFKVQIQKRLTDEPIPFNSTSRRPCLPDETDLVSTMESPQSAPHSAPPARRAVPPGPGAYDLGSESIVNKILKRTTGRHGVFGSCSARFNRHNLPADARKMLNRPKLRRTTSAVDPPGPGQYNIPRELDSGAAAAIGARGIVQRPASVFRSNVSRLDNVQYDSRSPVVLRVGSVPTPGVGEYRIPSAFSPQSPKKNIPDSTFSSKSLRFKDSKLPNGERISDTPGPGAYSPESLKGRKTRICPTLPSEPRFRAYTYTSTSEVVGPGAYVPQGSCLSKTYNVSYTTEKKL